MEDVVGWRLQDVVDLIRGPKDSVVRLNVLPKNQGVGGRSREVVLVRDEIKLEDKAAKSEVIELEGGIRVGVIEIPAFYRDFGAQAAGEEDFKSTTRDVRKLLEELQVARVDGVIIDLRHNGGGSLSEATELTGLFIEKGPVVQVRDSSGKVEVERDPDPEQVYAGPLAVLVDRNSASASEIFAGAIQDYNRGLILGEPTFGKGTVQTLVDLGRFLRSKADIGRLRLTMAQFFRVEGGSTQHRGVMPDIVYPTAKGAADHGERALDNALPWASIQPASYKLHSGTPVMTLRDASQRRIADNPGFQFLVAEEEELIELEARKVVSLQESVRRAEWDQREGERLERRNRLRAFRGLPPLASLDEDDEEDTASTEDDDEEGIRRIMLEETANILADHIRSTRPRTAFLN
jgi:carboxyl-terminal processing protease